MAISSPIPPETPLTSAHDAEMLPNQRTVGGTKNITRVGPGYYSFNWWLNGTNRAGRHIDVPGHRCRFSFPIIFPNRVFSTFATGVTSVTPQVSFKVR